MKTANKPKWQRAKIIKADNSHKSLIGRTLWIEIGPPERFNMIRAYDSQGEVKSSTSKISSLRYITNLLGLTKEIAIPAENVELLSGEDDFRVDVDLIGIKEWCMLKVDGVEK